LKRDGSETQNRSRFGPPVGDLWAIYSVLRPILGYGEPAGDSLTDRILRLLSFAGLANFSVTGLASPFTVPSVEIHVFPVISLQLVE
jgi:hypothetical protein